MDALIALNNPTHWLGLPTSKPMECMLVVLDTAVNIKFLPHSLEAVQ